MKVVEIARGERKGLDRRPSVENGNYAAVGYYKRPVKGLHGMDSLRSS